MPPKAKPILTQAKPYILVGLAVLVSIAVFLAPSKKGTVVITTPPAGSNPAGIPRGPGDTARILTRIADAGGLDKWLAGGGVAVAVYFPLGTPPEKRMAATREIGKAITPLLGPGQAGFQLMTRMADTEAELSLGIYQKTGMLPATVVAGPGGRFVAYGQDPVSALPALIKQALSK